MKIRILSDLHLEFASITLEDADEDLIILAGDIGINTAGIAFANKLAAGLDKPVLIIAGNHEFYHDPFRRLYSSVAPHSWESTLDNIRKIAGHTDKVEKGAATFLENTVVEYQGVRFIGATMWTDMKLFGDDPLVPFLVSRSMNDYRVIWSEETGEVLSAHQTMARHKESRDFIVKALDTEFAGPTVVITHHTPSARSVPPKYTMDKISAGYSSKMEPLIEEFAPALWCHGHTHNSYDYMIGKTRIICNPRGYDEIDPNFDFKPNLVVEV